MKIGALFLASLLFLTFIAMSGCLHQIGMGPGTTSNPVNDFEGTYTPDGTTSIFLTIEPIGDTSGTMILYTPYVPGSTDCYDKILVTLTHNAGTTFSSSWTDGDGDVHQDVETKLMISNDVLTMEREEDSTTTIETFNRFTESVLVYGNNCVKGCTDVTANNYDEDATDDDGSCIIPPPPVPGCMDDEADNYNPDATEDDEENPCVFSGCMDDEADNYWDKANQDDGLCIFSGCTNDRADNYWAKANEDDGSCVIGGCMDESAENYDAEATYDDESCDYGGQPEFYASDVMYLMNGIDYFTSPLDTELTDGLHDGRFGWMMHMEDFDMEDEMGGEPGGEEEMVICMIEYGVRADDTQEIYQTHFRFCMESEEEGDVDYTQRYLRQGPDCPTAGEEPDCRLYNVYLKMVGDGMSIEMTQWAIDEIPYYGDPVYELDLFGMADEEDNTGEVIEISGMQFEPQERIMQTGNQMVTWQNNDEVPHSIIWDGDAPGECGNSGTLNPGESYSCRLGNEIGTYTYHCGYHQTMTGEVIVEDIGVELTWTAPDDHPGGVPVDYWLLNATGQNETSNFYIEARVYDDENIGYDYDGLGILLTKLEISAREADTDGNREVIRFEWYYEDEVGLSSPIMTQNMERVATEVSVECPDGGDRCPFESEWNDDEQAYVWELIILDTPYNFERNFDELELRIMDCTDDEDDTDEACPEEEPEDDQIVFSVNLGAVMDAGGEYTYYDEERDCRWDVYIYDVDENNLMSGGDKVYIESYREGDRENTDCAAYRDNTDGSRTQQYGIARPYDVETDRYLEEMNFVWIPGFELIFGILAMLGIAVRRRLSH